MKNAIVSGLIIGILSGLWMFIMHATGHRPDEGQLTPIEFGSIFIPLVVLYFGIKSYRNNECKGRMGFLQALMQCFKILIVGGIITTAAAIIYIDEFTSEHNLGDFSGRIFGALLVGVLFSLGIAVLFTTKPNKID
ncbi:MAG TPA: DUF4199 domain-containing protein [Mucilaginibacter sp.]|jgi:hypothetical protein|nr:DUF4199 domain-containing protein [Mucilaginibacter sp.]